MVANHGVWDFDTPRRPNPHRHQNVDGRMDQGRCAVTKQGFTYVVRNRVTGAPVWPNQMNCCFPARGLAG